MFSSVFDDLFMLNDHVADVIESARIQVGHSEGYCILVVPCDSTDLMINISETIEKSFSLLNDTGLKFSAGISLGNTLKDILKHVGICKSR